MGVKDCDDIMTANCSRWGGAGWIAAVMFTINVSGFSSSMAKLQAKCLKSGNTNFLLLWLIFFFFNTSLQICLNILQQVAGSGLINALL